MNVESLTPQDLIRQAVMEVAQLQENELMVVIEMIDEIKKQRPKTNKEIATELVERARARATEMSHLSREEVMQKFSRAMDAIRAEAIQKGTAIS